MTIPALSLETITRLLAPYLDGEGSPTLYAQLSTYLDLLLKWNARTNLTAIRDPEEIVRRHFGESLFAARHLPPCSTLLDLGSGAGFPGLPIQLLRPEIAIVLAESQHKKAAFLREAVRTLHLTTEVWATRVESSPNPERRFDVVTLRAVDNMPEALKTAGSRSVSSVLILTVIAIGERPTSLGGFCISQSLPVPESDSRIVEILMREDQVPE